MKLTSFLLVATFLQVHGTAVSQTITLSGKNLSLQRVFAEIKSQTGFVVFSNRNDMDNTTPVTVTVKDMPLIYFLDDILRDQPVNFTIKGRTIILSRKQYSGQNTPGSANHFNNVPPAKISGTVVGSDNQPLGGATIRVQGKNAVVLSDDEGRFEITAEQGDVLLVSYVGFQLKQFRLSSIENVRIELVRSEGKLDTTEVVVVGYTSKQLSRISSSVSVVSGKELNDVTSNDIGALLQGKAAGVVVSNSSGNPNVSANTTIRGSGSISAGSDPLYVVDGIVGGNVNPNDVESITILKDAAAAGLYGSRAANGVIIITTKTGRAGKTKIQAYTSVGTSNVSTGNLKMMDSRQLYDYHKSFFSPEDFARDRPATLLDQNTDWYDLAYRTGIAQNYEVSVSGGSEKTRFYVSGKYYNEEGTLKYTGNEIYNFRANLSHWINSKVKLIASINGTFREFENEASGNYGALILSLVNLPWDNPYNTDGTIKKGTEPGWLGRENDNFLHGWQYNFDKGTETSMYGDLNLEYSILQNLKFTTYNRASFANKKSDLYYDIRAKAGRGLGTLTNRFSSSRTFVTSNRISYDKNFGYHSLNLIAVAEGERNFYDESNLYGTGIPEGLHVMETAATIQRSDNTPGNIYENIFSKALVQADYNYDNRYFFVWSAVKESSSRFGKDNRSATFYTLGGSWILTNEDFMARQDFFDFAKVRMSYGITGNANIGDYQALGIYSYGSQYAGNSAAVPFQLSNPLLTWEKANMFNVGIDLSFFKRISFTVDWYNKTTKALLLDVPLPLTSGYPFITQNVGSVRNKGFEFSVVSKNIDGKSFKWETRLNVAINRNKVLALNQNKDISQDLQRISVGRDLYSWYMRKWVGVDPQNGDPLWEKITEDANGNKQIGITNIYSEATEQFVGTASPDFTGGLFNSISYRSFSLTAFFNFVSGNTVWGPGESDGAEPSSNSRVLPPGRKRWQNAGDIATEPKPVFGGNKNSNLESSRFLEDGSYIRLRNITVGYNLPSVLLDKLKVSSVRIYLSGDNLWTLTDYSGMDPEVGVRRNGELNGDAGNNFQQNSQKYPISKKIMIGLSVSF